MPALHLGAVLVDDRNLRLAELPCGLTPSACAGRDSRCCFCAPSSTSSRCGGAPDTRRAARAAARGRAKPFDDVHLSSRSTALTEADVGRICARVGSAPASLIDGRNARMRSSASRSSRISSTTARVLASARASARAGDSGGALLHLGAETSHRVGVGGADDAAMQAGQWTGVGSRRAAGHDRFTSATVPTFAYSCSCCGTSRTALRRRRRRSVTVMPRNTTVSRAGRAAGHSRSFTLHSVY